MATVVSWAGVAAAVVVLPFAFVIAPAIAGVASCSVLLARSLVLAALSWRTRAIAVGLRLTVLAAVMVVAVASARPANRETSDLVHLLSDTPYVLAPPDGWAVQELASRADGRALVKAELATPPSALSPRRLLVLAELHAVLGEPPQELADACERLHQDVARYGDVQVQRTSQLCGPPATVWDGGTGSSTE